MSTEFRFEGTEEFVCVRFGAGGGELGFQFESVPQMTAALVRLQLMPETKLVDENGQVVNGEEMLLAFREAARFQFTEFFGRKFK